MQSILKKHSLGTPEFYVSEGVRYMHQSDVPDYLKHVDARLHKEQEQCFLFLDTTTRKNLVATAEKQLLEFHNSEILDMELLWTK